MKRTQLILLGLLALVAIGAVFLMLRNPQPPILPDNADHRWINADTCLDCHGVGRSHPQPRNHPVGRDCMRCHGRQASP